jgi:hypothetical protein
MLSGRNGITNKIASHGKKDAINKNQPSFCRFCIDLIYWIILDCTAPGLTEIIEKVSQRFPSIWKLSAFICINLPSICGLPSISNSILNSRRRNSPNKLPLARQKQQHHRHSPNYHRRHQQLPTASKLFLKLSQN